ncbi:MAG: hypothetical protein HQM09_19640 [Candidatus Riflebacteria bacterium]|nr:hypothetical protein [Candidatus Riflebacteria bacterium]
MDNNLSKEGWKDGSLAMKPVFPVLDKKNGLLALVNEEDLGVIAPRDCFFDLYTHSNQLFRTNHQMLVRWRERVASSALNPDSGSDAAIGILEKGLDEWAKKYGSDASSSIALFRDVLALKVDPDSEVKLDRNNLPNRTLLRKQISLNISDIVAQIEKENGTEKIKIAGGHRFQAIRLPNNEMAILISTRYMAMSENYWNVVLAKYAETTPEILLQATWVQDVECKPNSQGLVQQIVFRHGISVLSFSGMSIWTWDQKSHTYLIRRDAAFSVPQNALLFFTLMAPFPLLLLLWQQVKKWKISLTGVKTSDNETMMFFSNGVTLVLFLIGFLDSSLRIPFHSLKILVMYPLTIYFEFDLTRLVGLIVLMMSLQACTKLFDASKILEQSGNDK